MVRSRRMETAQTLFSRGQLIGLGMLAVLVVFAAVMMSLVQFLQLLLGIIIGFYVLFVGMKAVISVAGARFRFPELTLPNADDRSLPTYSILVPLYREVSVLPNLVKGLQELRYPVRKLQILLLLEADDRSMIEAVQAVNLPRHFEVVLVPVSEPRTKPKACDVAMGIRWKDSGEVSARLKGERTVIFDGEDVPEPDHLLKAVASLNYERAKDPRVVCVQAVLKFWNPRSGAPSPFYWGEYVVHFKWMLTGMVKLGLIPPLGGTSNHFLTSALLEVARNYPPTLLRETTTGRQFEIASVWDAYNVTEDADLAARLARLGYRIAMTNALTLEEAPNRLRTARNQRSRWQKGYIQTGSVHTRQPVHSMRKMGLVRYLAFNFFMLGTPLSLVLNPLMWGLTAFYITVRVTHWDSASLFVEALFSPPVYYIGMIVAVGGNLGLLYQKVTTPLKEGEYGLGKWLLLTPFWWAFTCLSTFKAVSELRPGKRFYWHKTGHGHDQDEVVKLITSPAPTALLSGTSGSVPTAMPVLPPQAEPEQR